MSGMSGEATRRVRTNVSARRWMRAHVGLGTGRCRLNARCLQWRADTLVRTLRVASPDMPILVPRHIPPQPLRDLYLRRPAAFGAEARHVEWRARGGVCDVGVDALGAGVNVVAQRRVGMLQLRQCLTDRKELANAQVIEVVLQRCGARQFA